MIFDTGNSKTKMKKISDYIINFLSKKQLFTAALFLFEASVFAVTFETKANITLGITPVEKITGTEYKKSTKSTSYSSEKQFGGAYLLGDFALSNEKITAAGKMYYRLKSSSSFDEQAQKIDIKRAYLRYRPFASNLLEFSLGKLYSYYLSGNYFQLAEIYTGASRWGKTGAGAKFEYKGFLAGLAFPVTENYGKFADYFGLNSAASYDFSNITGKLPLKLGVSVLYTRTGCDYSDKDDITDKPDYDFAKSVSAYFTPRLEGFFSRPALTITYSHNSEPFVSSSVFKKISNYSNSDMKKSQFVSLNWRNYFGSVQLLMEGEAGHSISGNMIPLYFGAQLLIPVYKKTVWFKPRTFYYAAINTKDNDNSRSSFEFYPRAWITAGKFTFSAGVDILHKEYEKDYWRWEWNAPVYAQYKIGK